MEGGTESHVWGSSNHHPSSPYAPPCPLSHLNLNRISADEALERAQRAFATRGDTSGDAASPATEEQRQLVRQFVAWLGQK